MERLLLGLDGPRLLDRRGTSWTNSLVPGYPADTSTEGMDSPEYVRTNNASDPVAAFNRDGTRLYFGSISYNGSPAPRRTQTSGWPATRSVRPAIRCTTTTRSITWDHSGRQGTLGRQLPGSLQRQGDDRGRPDRRSERRNVYMCWTKFPAFGSSQIYFSRSTDGGSTFSNGIAISPARRARDATSRWSPTAMSTSCGVTSSSRARRRTTASRRSARPTVARPSASRRRSPTCRSTRPSTPRATAVTAPRRARAGSCSRACRSSRGSPPTHR